MTHCKKCSNVITDKEYQCNGCGNVWCKNCVKSVAYHILDKYITCYGCISPPPTG